jgi:hypothetical protein
MLRCEAVSENLQALHDGELNPMFAWRVRRHLNRCADCAAQSTSLRHLESLLRANDILPAGAAPALQPTQADFTSPFPYEEEGRSSVLPSPGGSKRATGEVGWGVRARPRLQPRVALLGGLAFAVALIATLLFSPRTTPPVQAAARVRNALQNVNTWHLKGWKTLNGKKVAWEVWGRRTPFFYREQIGENLLQDDGTQRITILTPDASAFQEKGLFLRQPSLPDSDNLPWLYKTMMKPWQEATEPYKETPQGPVFNFSDVRMEGEDLWLQHLYAIDKRTWLPISIETCKREGRPDKITLAFLQAEYDLPLPEIEEAFPQPGYAMFDALTPTDTPPTEYTVTQNGLTVQVKPLALDREGNILVRMTGWLGQALLKEGDPVHFSATAKRWASITSLNPPSNYDDRGRAYASAQWADISNGNAERGTQLMAFIPLTPLPNDAPLPTQLTVTLHVYLWVGWGEMGKRLQYQEMSLTIPLPEPGEHIAEAARQYINPDWKNHNFAPTGFENWKAQFYDARTRHYSAVTDFRNLPEEARRSLYWAEKYIAAATTREVQWHRLDMARAYCPLGGQQRARQLLQDVLNDKRFLIPTGLSPHLTPDDRRYFLEKNREWNERQYQEARTMLREIDAGNRKWRTVSKSQGE